MKKFAFIFTLLFLSGAFFASAYTSPGKPLGFVNDFANIISENAQTQLEQKLSDFSKSTTIEIVVVTIPALVDETIEIYAVKLFQEWGIGDEEKDNGALFIVAPNERVVRIEVGYGLEGVLTDAQSNGIIQNIVLPDFRDGKMEEGIIKGAEAIVAVVGAGADYSEIEQPGSNFDFGNILSFIIIGFVWLFALLRSSKSWWLGGVFGAIAGIIIGFVVGSLIVGILSVIGLALLGLLIDYIVSKHPPKGPGGGGFWPIFLGGGKGGSGGGFGGFGGGMSGGGGASGRW